MSEPQLVDGARRSLAELEALHDSLTDTGGVIVIAGTAAYLASGN